MDIEQPGGININAQYWENYTARNAYSMLNMNNLDSYLSMNILEYIDNRNVVLVRSLPSLMDSTDTISAFSSPTDSELIYLN